MGFVVLLMIDNQYFRNGTGNLVLVRTANNNPWS